MIKRKNRTFGRLVVIKDDNTEGSIYPLKKDICVMGRDLNCDVRFDNPVVSRRHCEITYDGNNSPKLIQRSKLNSVLVNGNRIYKDYVLHHNDVITIGVKKLRFELLSNPKVTDSEKESNLENISSVLITQKPHIHVSTFVSNNSNCNQNVDNNKENEEINIFKLPFSQTLPTQSILQEKFYQSKEEKEKENQKELSKTENVSFITPKNADDIVDLSENKDQSINETSKDLSSSQALANNEANLPNAHSDCVLVSNINQVYEKNKEASLLDAELTDDKERDDLSIQNLVNMFVQNQISDDEKNKYTDKIGDSSQDRCLINDENSLAKRLSEGSFVDNQNDDIGKHESHHEMLALREENVFIKPTNCSFAENSIQICSNIDQSTTKEDNCMTESCEDSDNQANVFSVVIGEHGSYERECLKTPIDEVEYDNKDKVEESVITNTDTIDKLCSSFQTDITVDKSKEENSLESKSTNFSNLSTKTIISHSDIITEIIKSENEKISISNKLDNFDLDGERENNAGDLVKEDESTKSENLVKSETTEKSETRTEDEEFANKTSTNDYDQKLVQNSDTNSDKIMKREESEERLKKVVKNLRSAKKKKEVAKRNVENEEENKAKINLTNKGAKFVKVEANLDVSRGEDEDENDTGTVRKSRRARKPPKRFEISW